MTQQLQTPRLILEPFSPEDLEDYYAMFSDPRAMRFMPTLPHQKVEETRAWIEVDLSREGAAYWSIRLKNEQQAIGYVNFLGETRYPGMGYMVHPDYWGNGYAPEACRAALEVGFGLRGYDRVELWINEANAASQRVADKLGFALKGRIPQKYAYEEAHHFMLVYGLLAAEWREEPDVRPRQPSLFSVEPVLMVEDVSETAEFYRDRLGFQIDFLFGEPANHAAVSRGEWTGSTVTIQLTRLPEGRKLEPAGYLYIVTDARLDTLCQDYRARGVKIVAEPEDQPWGMREFTVRDLNGHLLVFATHS